MDISRGNQKYFFRRGAKSGEVSFYPLETKKTTFFADNWTGKCQISKQIATSVPLYLWYQRLTLFGCNICLLKMRVGINWSTAGNKTFPSSNASYNIESIKKRTSDFCQLCCFCCKRPWCCWLINFNREHQTSDRKRHENVTCDQMVSWEIRDLEQEHSTWVFLSML